MRPPEAATALRFAFALLVAAGVVLGTASDVRAETNWATLQAIEMTRQGSEHAARGDGSVGVRRFLEAIAFDPTYAPAYLALGELHEASGDPAEAERAYSMGIDHVGRWAGGLRARAKLRARSSRLTEAIADLEAAADVEPEDAALLLELEEAYVANRALVAALAVARRRESLASKQGERPAMAEARVRVRALATLVGDVDPVAAWARERGLVRSALARHARRR